ncbi:OLC1v1015364C1 [Oldenlandia corymbosa var. corymbosa]|uniref:OLC1v1015364C1 n=1 Tax=Oldenlandia corymbosa var. corymbosa TaxID=529605 RepID=A0AAV1E5F9_OLDCO|nr:OLC1v1015364C1 [Oldenlandia corymbosa var. corymbosa]
MEDVRSLSIIGQRTFDADSFGYDRLGEIAQVAERALSVNATNVVRHDLDRHVEVHDILSQELAPIDPTQQHPPPKPPRRSRKSQRGRGGQETITSSQPHQSSQHEQSHIPFTGGSSHQSPHRLHSILDKHSAHRSHIIHPIGLHIILRRPNGRFTVRLCLPAPKSQFCLHSIFLPSDFSAPRVTKEPDRLTYSLFGLKAQKK